ncbi:N-6 DNA methylase [Actinoalloteichus hymeniacidonis]|uniref:Type I restriction-modification system methyltransferase subunit n=1 Tax=Actinoalloteichus hymeniacidonis TaxID=340345 RepID=A0AAC9HMH5_9PSEU|nr:N-6 DNA methylase [Actinoalloteichus hymeniacidonis]AOS61848.1 type I restriction-modification system methyltransferase subunit [Actinoalloteichus hymeniacidonis]MBB5910132.1 type I restriction enzyme M protein [Actinoalloteichus hymeniacidonis]
MSGETTTTVGATVRRVGERLTAKQLADLIGVGVTTVSNWRKRHPDFPKPQRTGGRERFTVTEIVRWLDERRIAKNGLLDDEIPGTTYGLRFRRAAYSKAAAEPTEEEIRQQALTETVDRLWRNLAGAGVPPTSETTIELILELWHLRSRQPEMWRLLVDSKAAGSVVAAIGQPESDTPRQAGSTQYPQLSRWVDSDPTSLSVLVEVIDDVALPDGAGPGETAAELADRLLLRAQHALGSHYWVHVTPPSLVRCMTGLTRLDASDTVYDPFCGAGELVIAAVDKSGPAHSQVVGQATTERSRDLTKLRAELHGASVDLGDRAANSLQQDLHRGRKFRVVLANPPFNAPNPPLSGGPRAWPYGEPPAHNANFAWLQHAISKIETGGSAAVLMPNLTTSSEHRAEVEIRKRMIEAGVVRCIVAMPPRLFHTTGVPVSLWLLGSKRESHDREVLFIDATELGTMVDRVQRVLSEDDTDRIIETYLSWATQRVSRQRSSADGFARTGSYDEIRSKQYLLNPLSYVQRRPVTVNHHRVLAEVTEQRSRLAKLRADIVQTHADIESRLSGLMEQTGADIRATEASLGDVCELISGPATVTRAGGADSADAVRLVLPRNIRHHRLLTLDMFVADAFADQHPRYRLRPGDIVCTRTGDLGRYALVEATGRWLLGSGCLRLRPDMQRVDPGYLTYYLSSTSALAWLQRNATGSAIKNVSQRTLARMPLMLPDLSSQREIGALLGLLDAESQLYATSEIAVESVRSGLASRLIPELPAERV